MASHVQKDLHCPVCLAIFSDPVILPCSHSFCKACLQDWWREKKVRQCPLCKNTSREKEVLCNLVLKNLCEDFSAMETQSGSEDVCSLHGETLKVFCLDHQEPACVVCRDSETHRFRPVDEAAGLYRKKVQETLQVLKEKMKALSQVKGQYNHATEHIQVQARHTEAHIKQQFQELHRFLEEEEEVRLAALRNEESQKSRAMKEKMEALRREMSDLLDAIRASEKQLRASDVSLLTDLKSTMERVRDEPQMDTGALIDVAKHLGNLGFNIWRRMKDVVSLSPVVLDPNTAHSQLILSEALTAVSCGSRRQLPDNPERIKDFCSVLGSDGYSCGAHSWEVEVENNSRWVLGVLEESVQREGDFWSGLWTVQLCDDRHTAVSQSSSCLLSVKNLKTVRVDLDLDRHKLSFFDADNNTHLHTFTHTFKSKVFPYFWTGVDVPLRILPVEIDLRRISKW